MITSINNKTLIGAKDKYGESYITGVWEGDKEFEKERHQVLGKRKLIVNIQTYLNVADNSGARKLLCIRIIGASNHRYAHIGDVIIAVIKDAVPEMSLERSEVVRAVIVRTCKELKRDDGMIIRYDDNAAVVIDQAGNPKGKHQYITTLKEDILNYGSIRLLNSFVSYIIKKKKMEKKNEKIFFPQN